jgi:hypothetical protein
MCSARLPELARRSDYVLVLKRVIPGWAVPFVLRVACCAAMGCSMHCRNLQASGF